MAAPSKVIDTKQPHVMYVERSAVRVVAFNSAGEVAVVYAARDNYYKLPGGGTDPDEEHETAVHREMKEEMGGLIKLREAGCIAITEEYRNDLRQMSYCYCADLVDDSGAPALTKDEVQDELAHSWMAVDEAKRAMAAAEPTTELGRFIKERDLFLLDAATKDVGKWWSIINWVLGCGLEPETLSRHHNNRFSYWNPF